MSLRRVAVILVVLAVGATAVFVALTLLKEPEPPPKPLSNANFVAAEVRAVDPQDRPESPGRATEQSTKIIELLNHYYQLAFLRPARWNPDPEASPPPIRVEDQLGDIFTADARTALAPNIQALGLSALARSLERVDPRKQEATKLSVEFEVDGTMPFAVVNVSFEAIGTLVEDLRESRSKDGRSPVVEIAHDATLWLALEADAYRIFAYSAEFKADEKVRSASWGLLAGNLK